MKKFGTPIGAAPGNANENVGFDADGTPPEPRSFAGLVVVVEGVVEGPEPCPLATPPL
jgi:hypothetical protein